MELIGKARRQTLLVALAWAASLIVASVGAATAGTLITSAQIRDNSLLSADIRDGQITSADIRDAQVTGDDIRTMSIYPNDINLLAKTELSDTSSTNRLELVGGNSGLRVETRCGLLKYATGGGAKALLADDGWALDIRESYPTSDDRGWVVTVGNSKPTATSVYFYAMCSGPIRG